MSDDQEKTTIKTIIPAGGDYYAAYCSDEEEDIESRIEKVICWSLLTFEDDETPDEVVGQIIVGSTIMETTVVDEEDGFGAFLGYYMSEDDADVALRLAEAEFPKDEDDDEDDDEEDDEDEEDEEEEEGDE